MHKRLTTLSLALLLLLVPAAFAQSVDEIIAKNIEATGGADAWLAIKTVKMAGAMRFEGGAVGAVEMPFFIEAKRPHKVRVEFTMQGMTGIQAFDGTTAWGVMPFLGKTTPEELATDERKRLETQAEFDGVFLNYKEKGHTIELVGKEEVEGTPAFKLKITKKNGDIEYHYLDEEYFVTFKTESQREVQGQTVTLAQVLGDYKEVGGVLFPHSIEIRTPEGTTRQVITIDSIEIDVDLPDSRFAMPAAQEAPAAAAPSK